MSLNTLMKPQRTLEAIYEDFGQLRTQYNQDPLKGSGAPGERERMLYYSDKFTDLYVDIGPYCAMVYGRRTEHDDKATGPARARIAKSLQEEDEKLSWNKVVEYASASEDYKDFLSERVYYYESWDSIDHLRDSIKQYIINIGQRLSNK